MSASREEMSAVLALVGVALMAAGFWLILKKPDSGEDSSPWGEIIGGNCVLSAGSLFVLQLVFVFLR